MVGMCNFDDHATNERMGGGVGGGGDREGIRQARKNEDEIRKGRNELSTRSGRNR